MIFSRVDWMQTVSTHLMLVFDWNSEIGNYDLYQPVDGSGIWYPAQEHGMWEQGFTAELVW